MYGIYANIGGILMGSMLPYIAAPWILWVCESEIQTRCWNEQVVHHIFLSQKLLSHRRPCIPFQTNFAKQPDLNNLGIPSKTRPQDWFAGFAFYLHIQSAVFIGTVATYGRIVGSIHVEHQLTSGLGFQDLLFDSKEAGRIKCLPRHFLTRCDQQY